MPALIATPDRPNGYWDPNPTSKFDNLDGTPVRLVIDEPGTYVVTFGGYVKSHEGEANQEVNVIVSPVDQTDPFQMGECPAIGTKRTGPDSDHWLTASGVIEVTDPVQVVAWLYSNEGDMRARVVPAAQSPSLAASRIG